MLLWSYFSAVLTDPPLNWRPVYDEETGVSDPLTATELGDTPSDQEGRSIRLCRKCNQLKLPRCHHCSACGRCVLKMDHHCVWVVNCVGALNYKYFLLFLDAELLEEDEDSFERTLGEVARWEQLRADCEVDKDLLGETCKPEKWLKCSDFDDKSILDCGDSKLTKALGHDETLDGDVGLGIHVDTFYPENPKWFDSPCDLDTGTECSDGGFRHGEIV